MGYPQIKKRVMVSVLGVDCTEYMLYNRHLTADWKLKKLYGKTASDFDIFSEAVYSNLIITITHEEVLGKGVESV